MIDCCADVPIQQRVFGLYDRCPVPITVSKETEPSHVHAESLSTAKFAQRAKAVRNAARVNEDLDQRTLLRRYEGELRRLRAELQQRQRDVVDKRQLLQARAFEWDIAYCMVFDASTGGKLCRLRTELQQRQRTASYKRSCWRVCYSSR